MSRDQSSPIDLVGIGFGPANLAVAIAVEEANAEGAAGATGGLQARFFEKKEKFAWHPGMLLPGATMQVSFLKDLVTQRNAQSSYSFLNYLAEQDRLQHFINLQDFFPLRAEFHDYLKWSAARVSAPVDYGTEITGVTWRDGCFEVTLPSGEVVRANNLSLGGGLRAKLPAGVTAGRRVVHNHRVLDHLAELPEHKHGRFVVVGAGQSAAEVAAHLHSETDATVHAVFAKYGYTPADDSPYANRVFDSTAVDEYFGASPAWRERMLQYHRSTNYSAVDPALINDLYRREYAERVSGDRRYFVQGSSEVVDVTETDDAATVTVRSHLTGEVSELVCDAVIFCTGFEPTPVSAMLGGLAGHCHEDVHGRPMLDRAYRLETDDEITGQIFVHGYSEHTHGLTSTLLSNLAVRAGEIVDAIDEHRQPAGVPQDWTAAVSSG
ncbi:MAG: SidA/IucD/PvdA family monooxygenase [Gordonia sp. (in: high G+C Gram-positive bacteria)]